jgi:hypothetical protein
VNTSRPPARSTAHHGLITTPPRARAWGCWWRSKGRKNFSGSGWSGGGTVTLDSAIADPTGATGGVYYVSSSERTCQFAGSGTNVCISFFAKARSGGGGGVYIQIYQSVSPTVIDLGAQVFAFTGAIDGGSTNANFTSLTRTAYPNGWYRFSAVVTAPSGTFNSAARFDIEGGVYQNYIWGVQVEAGSFPTSYIPTTTAAVTRNADVASITGSNFSSWYRQDEGTVFAEAMKTNFGSTYYPWICSARVTNQQNAVGLYVGNALGDNSLVCRVSNVDQAVDTYSSTSANRFTNNVSSKICGAYKVDNFAMSTNGQGTRNDTLGQVPSGLNELLIGNGDGIWNGTIRRLTYWPSRLPNATLQQITQ